jgi:hypothetical protein
MEEKTGLRAQKSLTGTTYSLYLKINDLIIYTLEYVDTSICRKADSLILEDIYNTV